MIITTPTDVKIHVQTYGPASRPPVVLLHSLATDSSIWDDVQKRLQDKFHVVCIDLRGHGKSSCPTVPYTIADLAADVVHVAETLDLSDAHLVGLSMGGMITQHIAIHHPERFRTFTIAGSISRTNPEMQKVWFERANTARAQGMASQVSVIVNRWFSAHTQQCNQAIVGYVAQLISNTSLDGYLGCCTAIAHLDLDDQLGRIKKPCLVIVGSEDPGTPPAVSRRIHEMIEGAEFIEFAQASHQLFLDQPELSVRALVKFLDRRG